MPRNPKVNNPNRTLILCAIYVAPLEFIFRVLVPFLRFCANQNHIKIGLLFLSAFYFCFSKKGKSLKDYPGHVGVWDFFVQCPRLQFKHGEITINIPMVSIQSLLDGNDQLVQRPLLARIIVPI